MTAATDPGTPIYHELCAELLVDPPLSTQPGRGAHAAPLQSACTPVEWFGPMPSPVHGREGATEVIPAVVDEQERRAS